MPYSFDDIDVIDLERALDEGRITPFVDNKSYKISLKSVDDDVLNNIRGSLVTPLPNDRPVSRTESVMLFKNILNGNEQVTVDFVSSDLNDFIGNFSMDDLISRPGSRVPSVKTPPLYQHQHHHQYHHQHHHQHHHHHQQQQQHKRDSSSLLLLNNYSDLHEFPSSPTIPANDDISNQGYVRDSKRHLRSREEYPLHIHGYTPSNGFTRRRSSPSLIDTTTTSSPLLDLEQKRLQLNHQLLSAVEKSYRSEELKRINNEQRKIKNELSFDKAKKRHSINMGLQHDQFTDEHIRDARRWSSSYLPDHHNEPVYYSNNSLYQQQQQRHLGRNNNISQRRQSEIGYSRLSENYRSPKHNNTTTIPIAESHQPPQKPRLQPQRGGGTGGKQLLKNHIEAINHRNRAYSVPTTEPNNDTYKRDRRFSNNNNSNTLPIRQEKPMSFIPQPRRRSSKLYEGDIKPLELYSSSGGESSTSTASSGENMPLNRQKLYPLPTRGQKQEQERRQKELLAHKRHSYIDLTVPRGEVFRSLPPKDPSISRRQRVLSEGTRTKKVSIERKSSTVVEDAKNVLEMVRQRRQNTMSKR